MVQVAAYQRPATLGEALALLRGPAAMPLAGGTHLCAWPAAEKPFVAVDLQALGLAGVEPDGAARLRVGSMTTLQDLADAPAVPDVVRTAARRELPSTLRTAATVGGTIAVADPDSELLAAFLVHEAVVGLAGTDGSHEIWLEALLGHPEVIGRRIITAVTIDPRGRAAAVRTGRTPADRPIVAAVARRTPAGGRLLALTGVARTPVLVSDPDEVRPAGDFRGTAEYRRALATTLAARALAGVT